jgi:hypothetical protein
MSSAILYIGIVAIWAFVLVPRWLRRDHEQPEAAADNDAEAEAQPSAEWRSEPGRADDREGFDRVSDPPEAVPEVPTPSRSRVIQARRRLLTMLLALSFGAAACFLLKLTPWWAIVPPAGTLGLFLLVLRQATLADAEQARRRSAQAARARIAHQRGEAVARRGVATLQPADEPPASSAQVIDISARVGDQLYDQYADATIRAVGD